MNISEKIISLRKNRGWSQEELAERLSISRQSVSKWESGSAIPDVDKIILLSEIFEVSTDYLLKSKEKENINESFIHECKVTKVSCSQAEEYLTLRRSAAKYIALGTLLCILSVIPLLIITVAANEKIIPLSETVGLSLSLSVLLTMVAAAVALFIFTGIRSGSYSFLEKDDFELEQGAEALVREKKNSFADIYLKANIIGAVLCIISVIPFIALSILNLSDLITVISLCSMLFVLSIAVFVFIYVGVVNASMEKLLGEGDYSKKSLSQKRLSEAIASIYWCVITALYLGYSFSTSDWGRSWIIWPVSGVLFGIVEAILTFIGKKDKDNITED